MDNNINELEKSIKLFLQEISQFKQQLLYLNECEENQKKINNKQNIFHLNPETNEKSIQQKETEYDQLYELYSRNKQIVDNEKSINNLLEKIQQNFQQIIEISQMKKNENGDKLNDLLCEINQNEMETKSNEEDNSNESIKNNIENLFVQTEKMTRMEETKMRQIKFAQFLSLNEISVIENEIGRCLDEIIFDSNIHS